MFKNTPTKAPPPDGNFMAPIIFHIQSLYKDIYLAGNSLTKRDKLGVHAAVEKSCLEMLGLSIQASLENQIGKQKTIKKLRIDIEILKHLIRAESELGIIREKQYLSIQEKLQEISKEAAGWDNYTHKNSQQRELL